MTQSKNDSYKESWYYKKHEELITVIRFGDNVTSFWQNISDTGNYPLFDDENSDDEFIFDWNKIHPHYAISINYDGCEETVEKLLLESILPQHDFVMFSTQYSDPIFKIRTKDFIKNWVDFTDANIGMGSIVCSEDYSLLIEFTNDHSYLLISNFSI